MTEQNYIFSKNANIKLQYQNFKTSIDYNSVEGLKKMLCKHGPVMITMWADNPIFKNRTITTNILNCSDFDANRADHAVLLVGYQQNDKGNFWIIQNSWDKNWGNHGLFAITMNCGNISKYFQSYCFVESISGEINYNDKYPDNTFDHNQLDSWTNQEFYDENLKTGFSPPPVENSELDSFYANISQDKMVKTSNILSCDSGQYTETLDWSNPNMNPYGKVIICETDNQAYCGSCWLFALTNMLQSSLSLNRLKLTNGEKTYNVPISKQYTANNMKNMKNPYINQKFVCNGGNSSMFKHLILGGNFYLNGTYQKENGLGVIANELCKYMCQNGDVNCVQQKCSKEVPKYEQKSEKIDDAKQVNLENIWEKYGVYIVILIVIIIVVIVSL
jgi:C1A family cysteine protease